MLKSHIVLFFIVTSIDLHVSFFSIFVFQKLPWQKGHIHCHENKFSLSIVRLIYLSEINSHCSETTVQECCAIASNHTNGQMARTHSTLGSWAYVWRALWSWRLTTQVMVTMWCFSHGSWRSTEMRRFTGSMILCWSPKCEKVPSPRLESSPGIGTVVLQPGRPLSMGGSCCHAPVWVLYLGASLTCFGGADQLFLVPPAMMLSQPIKILFHSQQGSWQPWVFPAGWAGCN